MTGAHRLACQIATLLLLLTLTTLPAKAQFGGFGGGGGSGGGGDMMTQMAPMLEMMKAKMGKRRFGALMQTMGPMMSRMMENGGGGIPGGFGGGDFTSMLGGSGGGELMSMIPQVMQMANLGGGHGHRRHRRR